MRKTLIIICFFITPLFSIADIYAEISTAIRSGNSKQLAAYFNTNVDLAILSQEEVYSKAQAEMILKDFFSKNTPKSFTIMHKGTSKEGAMYGIGKLTTTAGINYRIYFFIKQTSGKNYIQELRFEKE